jgi:aminopeptidase-like protein
MKNGEEMFQLAKELWPIGRSLSGPGVRQTLDIIGRELPELTRKTFQSGEKVFDWEVPKEWKVHSATLTGPDGGIICDYDENNLSLVGYSRPISGEFSLEELESHLYSLSDQPDAVPYVTSYYKDNWGFCVSQSVRDQLVPGVYRVEINTALQPGVLDYGEVVIRGESEREIFFSTYVCHPSMANNELSGPVLAVALAKFVRNLSPHYTYRFLFIPETIGSIAYLAHNLASMKSRMLAGYLLTCVGDERVYSYVPSRSGTSVADEVALEAFEQLGIPFLSYTWSDRGSDERQYCAPGVDLPVCSVMRSKYGKYPEYHTSLDRLGTVVTAKGLQETYDYYRRVMRILESQRYPRVNTLCEPQLGKRGLYPDISIKGSADAVRPLTDVISEADGHQSMQRIAQRTGLALSTVQELCDLLVKKGLVSQ